MMKIWDTKELMVYSDEQIELQDAWTKNFITLPKDELTAFCKHWLKLNCEPLGNTVMGIIKVIVDELPWSCGNCPLCTGVSNRAKYITEQESFCTVRFEYITSVEDMITRPPECPLEIEREERCIQKNS